MICNILFKSSIVVLILISTVISDACGQTTSDLRIDPRYVRGATVSNIVDEVTFIPMETSAESTFGILQRISVDRENYVFYDFTTNAIYIYFKDGRFHSKITELPGLKKEATREFQSMSNFSLNPWDKNIYVVYETEDKKHSKRLVVFNTDGKLLRSTGLNASLNDLGTTFHFIDKTTTLFTNRRGYKNAKFVFYQVKDFDKIISGNVELDGKNPFDRSWVNDFNLTASTDQGSIWSRSYDNSVYIFDKNGQPNIIRFLLPATLALDQEFYNDSAIIGNHAKSVEYLMEHPDKILAFGNIRKLNEWLSFTLHSYGSGGARSMYLYNTKSDQLLSFSTISSDSLSYFFSLFKSGPLVVGTEGDYLYLSLPSFSFYNAIKNSTNKQWETNEVLSKYIREQNPKSNPVLIRVRLRKSMK
jgi:hypothetical protein